MRQKDKNDGWEAMVAEADEKRRRGEKRPDPPPPSATGSKKRHDHTASTSRPIPVAAPVNPEMPTPSEAVQAAKAGGNLPQLANQPFSSRVPIVPLPQTSPGQQTPLHSPQKQPPPEHSGLLSHQAQAMPTTAQLQQEIPQQVHPSQAHAGVPQAISPSVKAYPYPGERAAEQQAHPMDKAAAMHGTETPPKRALAPMRPSAVPASQGAAPAMPQADSLQAKQRNAAVLQQVDQQPQQAKRALAPMRPSPAVDSMMQQQQPEAQSQPPPPPAVQSRRPLAPMAMAQPQSEAQQPARILTPMRPASMVPQAAPPHAEPSRDRTKMEAPRAIDQRGPVHLKQEPDTVPSTGPYDYAAHAPSRPPQGHLDLRPTSPAKRQEWGPTGYGRGPEPTGIYSMSQGPNDGRPRPLDQYGDVAARSQASVPSQPIAAAPTPAPPAPAPARAPEPKKSSLMALLNEVPNDEPPPPAPMPAAPKAVGDVMGSSMGISSPQPQKMQGHPRAPPPANSQLSREQEAAAYGYSHTSVAPTPSGMPPLKPYASPQGQHMNIQRPGSVVPQRHEPPPMGPGHNYYQQTSYAQHHTAAPSTPAQAAHRLTHSQAAPVAYQGQTGYAPYGSQPHSSAASPPPAQYSMHPPTSRPLEHAPLSRDVWSTSSQSHVPQSPAMMSSGLQKSQPGGWPVNATPKPMQSLSQPPKSWDPVKVAGAPGAGAPLQTSWSPTPPQQQHYSSGLRSELVPGPGSYGSPPTSMAQQGAPSSAPAPSGIPPHGHMQSQYPPPHAGPPSREPISHYAPSPYGLRPGQGGPHDARDMPGRSYTPVSAYDARGPPPPHAAYGSMAADSRDMQMRDMAMDPRSAKDPRDPRMQGQMRPHDRYDPSGRGHH